MSRRGAALCLWHRLKYVDLGSSSLTVLIFPTGFGFNFAADEQVLSTSMMSYWGSFAWNGNPNVEGQAGMYVLRLHACMYQQTS